MINLLDETTEKLTTHGKRADDVRWVGSRDGQYAISWAQFEAIARDLRYDNGFGGEHIALDLVVVGDDWWLERHEYDGSEWWEFKQTPVRRADAVPFQWIANSQDGYPGWRYEDSIHDLQTSKRAADY